MCLGLGFRVVVQDTGIGLSSMCIYVYIDMYMYISMLENQRYTQSRV